MSSRQSSATTSRGREKEPGYDNLKSMGLKAGVLAVITGLAFYPKIASDANSIERNMKHKENQRDSYKRERRRVEDDRRERGSLRRRESTRPSERRAGGGLMRVDEYDIKRGEGFSHRDERRGKELRMMRRESVDEQRRKDNVQRQRRWDDASIRSAGGSDRTKEWVTGGYEYVSP